MELGYNTKIASPDEEDLNTKNVLILALFCRLIGHHSEIKKETNEKSLIKLYLRVVSCLIVFALRKLSASTFC